MKLAISLLALVSTAAAFAPSSGSARAPMTRFMSDEAAVEEEAPAAAEEEAAPMLEIKEKVPIWGAIPTIGSDNTLFIGENWWDKITMEWGSAETGTFIRAAELKHGRSAMLATVGFAFHKLGLTLDNISPHEYLSITQGIKFADLAAMTPLDALKSLPAESWGQMFAAIALVEIYELTHVGGKLAYDETVAPGLSPGGLTGDLGWNPLGVKVTDRRKLVELQNGRAAMFAISAWVAHDSVAGSVPLPLPWE